MEHITGLCLLILLRNSICSSLDGDTRNSCIKPGDELKVDGTSIVGNRGAFDDVEEDGTSIFGNREAFDVSLRAVVGNGDIVDDFSLIAAVDNGDEANDNSLSSVDITSSVLSTSCKSASGSYCVTLQMSTSFTSCYL